MMREKPTLSSLCTLSRPSDFVRMSGYVGLSLTMSDIVGHGRTMSDLVPDIVGQCRTRSNLALDNVRQGQTRSDNVGQSQTMSDGLNCHYLLICSTPGNVGQSCLSKRLQSTVPFPHHAHSAISNSLEGRDLTL